jgi:hypothetical protein
MTLISLFSPLILNFTFGRAGMLAARRCCAVTLHSLEESNVADLRLGRARSIHARIWRTPDDDLCHRLVDVAVGEVGVRNIARQRARIAPNEVPPEPQKRSTALFKDEPDVCSEVSAPKPYARYRFTPVATTKFDDTAVATTAVACRPRTVAKGAKSLGLKPFGPLAGACASYSLATLNLNQPEPLLGLSLACIFLHVLGMAEHVGHKLADQALDAGRMAVEL